MAPPDTVVVFSGGRRPSTRLLAEIPRAAPVVGADRGAAHALALGLPVVLAVGDFDSLSARELDALERSGARLERHPPAKDATDLELALDAASALRPRRILVVGAPSGRLDHLLGELLLLGAERYRAVELDALYGRARVHLIRGERRLTGEPGELVSLFALHGEARGVTTEGLAYPLTRARLRPGETLGVSNIFSAVEARIALDSGVIAAVRPGRRASRAALRSAPRSSAEGSGSS
jgi:thiamine pyrophosphokinase